jgi:hypothetical protein
MSTSETAAGVVPEQASLAAFHTACTRELWGAQHAGNALRVRRLRGEAQALHLLLQALLAVQEGAGIAAVSHALAVALAAYRAHQSVHPNKSPSAQIGCQLAAATLLQLIPTTVPAGG